jgi:hypothetical protein
MIKTLTSYLQLDEFTENQDKLIFLFANCIPSEIKELISNCQIEVIIINPNIFEALNKKYHIKGDLTLVFFDHNFGDEITRSYYSEVAKIYAKLWY